MLTLIGLNKLKNKLIKMGQPGDTAVNAILQRAVNEVNALIASRFP